MIYIFKFNPNAYPNPKPRTLGSGDSNYRVVPSVFEVVFELPDARHNHRFFCDESQKLRLALGLATMFAKQDVIDHTTVLFQ